MAISRQFSASLGGLMSLKMAYNITLSDKKYPSASGLPIVCRKNIFPLDDFQF
jgi:hypothetical protein